MKRFRFSIPPIVTLAICAAQAELACAQVKTIETENEPTTYRMTVSAAPEPQPALKYRFLVPPVDQIQGNAATLYYKAAAFQGYYQGSDPIQELDKASADDAKDHALFEGTFEEFPQAEAERLTRFLSENLDYSLALRKAAACDYCNWEDGIKEKGIYTMLPYAQNSRILARAIALRARLQLVQHKPDAAFETLRLGYALSRNLGKSSTLVQTFVGIAIQGFLNNQTRELIASEGSPNLYWALTDLATHPVGVREGLSFESRLWESTIHQLADIDRRIYSPEEALRVAKDLAEAAGSMGYRFGDSPAEILGVAMFWYPHAKRDLLERDYSAERIDAMPIVQVVMLSWWRQYALIRDNYFKWFELPDDEIDPYLSTAYTNVRTAELKGEGGPFVLAMPALQAAVTAHIRSQREIDELRVVEALRLHAAQTGRWPEKLDDITIVPVPLDPWNHKPFEYSVKNGVAILEPLDKPPMAGGPAINSRYELTLRTPTNSK